MSAIDLAYQLAGIKAALWTLVLLLSVWAVAQLTLRLLAIKAAGAIWAELVEGFKEWVKP